MPKKPASPADQSSQNFVRPDWRDKNAYKWIESASLQAIAWEFLRRNSDYCKAYSGYLDRVGAATSPDDVNVAYWKDANGAECSEVGVDDARAHQLALEKTGLTLQPLSGFMGAPWGLEWMAAPSTGYGGSMVRFTKHGSGYGMLGTQYFTPDRSMTVRGTKGTPIVHFEVDLSMPLAVLDATLKSAVRAQRQLAIERGDVTPTANRAVRKALYAQYLCILDGLHDGQKAADIGAVLEPKRANDSRIRERDKRYNAAAKEADRLMKGGYKVLPILDSDRRKTVRKK